MSVELASIEDVKAVLRIGNDEEDAALTIYLQSASRAILRYLQGGGADFYDDVTDTVVAVPEDVRLATIFYVGIMRRNPDRNDESIYPRDGSLPAPVETLVGPMRRMSVA